MIAGLPLGFAEPLVLVGLLTLPMLWWLLRLMPPRPRRIEFVEPEGGGRITAGRAETWRSDYTARVERHRAAIRAETDRLGWSFAIHRTDRPPSELLLALHARIGAAAADVLAAAPQQSAAGGPRVLT